MFRRADFNYGYTFTACFEVVSQRSQLLQIALRGQLFKRGFKAHPRVSDRKVGDVEYEQTLLPVALRGGEYRSDDEQMGHICRWRVGRIAALRGGAMPKIEGLTVDIHRFVDDGRELVFGQQLSLFVFVARR